MRLVLFTGKGGVGKTTVAAATATAVAARGQKVLLVFTDEAHSLGDVLGVPLGAVPVEVEAGLSALQVDPQSRFEHVWAAARNHLVELLGRGGLGAVAAEELTVLPGVAELVALDAVREHATGGRYDAVVVDCAPTAETLRLLALPRVLDWYLERALPAHRRVVRGLGPFLGGVALPGDAAVAAVSRLHGLLRGVQELLDDAASTVRLVLTPESLALAEARRTATSLALFGYRLDGVVVNRLVPAGRDRWRSAQAAAQGERLAEARACFPNVPVHTAAYRPGEPIGTEALAALATELYDAEDPLAVPDPVEAMSVRRKPNAEGERYELVLPLPHARREDLDLARSGEELIVTVAGQRRLLALPGVLRRCTVERAELVDGRLVVAFRPDPGRWPRAEP